MNASLKDQVGLVTGAWRGIGRMVACRLAQAGIHVVANFLHNVAAAEETVQRIAAAGGRATLAQFDVSDPEAVQAAVSGLVERLGRCNILVNNVGMTVNALVLRLETEMTANLPEAVRTEYVRLIPAGRLGTVEEVAEAVLFLACPESAYITGQVIGVNGGLYM
jgi:NAD(P)-dependent dehydrogenase (short-subunit alcohol dehydrogenase family)